MSDDHISNEANQWEQLCLRLLTAPFHQDKGKSRLFFGKLPENFPVDVPMPERTRVLGTLARGEQDVTIVLESDLTQDEIESFYRTQFTKRDWIEPEDMRYLHRHMMGGFTHSFISDQQPLTFCRGEEGPVFRVLFAPHESAGTAVNLHINFSSEANPLVQQKLIKRNLPPGWNQVIPVLTPPAGSRQDMMNGSGGGSDWQRNSGATLTSDLALDVLARHYGEQLLKAGWVQNDTGENGLVAWYTWNFTDEDQDAWKALFFILKKPDEEQTHLLFVQAERVRTQSKSLFSGWLG